MTRLSDIIVEYFHDNANMPCTVEDIRPYVEDMGRSVFSDTLRRTMAGDSRFESVTVKKKNWKKWRLKTKTDIKEKVEVEKIIKEIEDFEKEYIPIHKDEILLKE